GVGAVWGGAVGGGRGEGGGGRRAAPSAGALRKRASGRPRSPPRPEQGASAITRSNEPGRQAGSVPSATMAAPAPVAETAACTSRARCSLTSEATRRAPRPAASPASSRAFPPPPAHRSSHRRAPAPPPPAPPPPAPPR